MGRRNRDQPGQPPGPGTSRQNDLLPRSANLPVLDDVPDRAAVPSLGFENLEEGKVVNQIKVPEAVARDAKLALDRMIAITG